MPRVAVVQHPPVLLDRAATIARGVQLLEEAASEGAELVSFPETWLPGYPVWLWRLRPGTDYALTAAIHDRLLANSIDIAAGDLADLQQATARLGVTVAVGIHELDRAQSRGTLFNTLVLIGPDGEILNRHRKLMPTNPERMVWGQGDASGLRVVETAQSRVGGLICWENYMPLSRYAIYAQGVEIYLAPTWDAGDGWVSTLRHIALEGRCWVLGNGCALHARDIPEDFPERATVFPDPDEWLNPGDSAIVAPRGRVVSGPLSEEYGILYADCDPAVARGQRRTLDVVGHYARPDIFTLHVANQARVPVIFPAAESPPT